LAACSRDHGYCRRGIFAGLVLQLYRTSYTVRSAFLATATVLGIIVIVTVVTVVVVVVVVLVVVVLVVLVVVDDYGIITIILRYVT